MATVDADNLEFCTDCVMLIANGEVFNSEGRDIAQEVSDRQVAIWGEGINGVLGLVLACPEDCDGWFSWSQCDGCGSTLGGDRHPGAHLSQTAFNDPRVTCCNRDIADCDCENPQHD